MQSVDTTEQLDDKTEQPPDEAKDVNDDDDDNGVDDDDDDDNANEEDGTIDSLSKLSQQAWLPHIHILFISGLH